VRSNFTPEPIDAQVLMRILEAAHHAPSVGFSQPWNFILIKNIETRKKIKESFEKEKARSSNLIEEPRRSKYLSYKLEGILDSSINVCVTYDPTKSGSFVIGVQAYLKLECSVFAVLSRTCGLQQEQRG